MAKARSHKSQHYVPQCYSGAWIDSGAPANMKPYVWLFERDSRVGRRKAPKNIFEETDFYTIQRSDGVRDLFLEKGLSELESRFVTARAKLQHHEQLEPAEFAYLAAFVAAMSSRTKAQRDHQRTQWGRAKGLMDSMNEQLSTSTAKQRESLRTMFSSARDPDKPTWSYSEVKSIVENPMAHVLRPSISVITPILERMSAAVLETTDAVGFITSDNPCVVHDPEGYKRPPMYRNPGLLTRSVEVTLPLSPQQLILFSWSDVRGILPVPRRIVDGFNQRTRVWAYEHFVVNRNVTRDAWFSEGKEPDDSWEKTHGSAGSEPQET